MTFPQQPEQPKSKAIDKLKQAWNDNPIAFIGVTSVFLHAAAKFIDSVGSYQSKQAYAKETKRREKASK